MVMMMCFVWMNEKPLAWSFHEKKKKDGGEACLYGPELGPNQKKRKSFYLWERLEKEFLWDVSTIVGISAINTEF